MRLIWVLVDDRVGNNNHAIGLADALEIPYELKKIEYNWLGKLPNFLQTRFLLQINKQKSNNLKPPYPDIIISAGRRTAAVAASIKTYAPSLKIIQIMRPNLAAKNFDLIILPQHDTYTTENNKIYYTLGAINKLNDDILTKELFHFKNHYSGFTKDLIAVLVGGNNKSFQFTLDEARALITQLKTISLNQQHHLFITFSRRTPEYIKKEFYGSVLANSTIYDPLDGGYNPYLGLLAAANFVISTGDSISMCSDIATSGKPQYIFTPKEFTSSKHRYFIQQLVDLGIARRLDQFLEVLECYSYQPLNEATKAARYIKDNILNN